MKTRNCFLAIALLASLAFAPATSAQNSTSSTPGAERSIEINADRMRSENAGQKIIFSGNVVGVWGDLTIQSDVLEVYNTDDKSKTEEIVAMGNVQITRGETKAQGDRAIYLDSLQKIILTGVPKATAWQGKDIIEGREMIFLLEKDRFVVNHRVRMKLFPKSKDDKKSDAQDSAPGRTKPPEVASSNNTNNRSR